MHACMHAANCQIAGSRFSNSMSGNSHILRSIILMFWMQASQHRHRPRVHGARAKSWTVAEVAVAAVIAEGGRARACPGIPAAATVPH